MDTGPDLLVSTLENSLTRIERDVSAELFYLEPQG
jgi:hypothetical protein